MDWQSTLSSVKPICHHQAALSTPPSDSRSPSKRLPRSGWTKISTACPQNWAAPAAIGIDWICPEYVSKPERRGRKPGTSWNGGRRVESMAGIAVGGWLRSPFNAGTNSLSLSPKHLACASSTHISACGKLLKITSSPTGPIPGHHGPIAVPIILIARPMVSTFLLTRYKIKTQPEQTVTRTCLRVDSCSS